VKRARGPGRPRSGTHGRSVSLDYRQLLLRLPPEVHALIRAAAEDEGLSVSAHLEAVWSSWFTMSSRVDRDRIRRMAAEDDARS